MTELRLFSVDPRGDQQIGKPLNWRVSRHLNIYTGVATREIIADGSLRVKEWVQLHACKEVSERDKRELPANWKSPASIRSSFL